MSRLAHLLESRADSLVLRWTEAVRELDPGAAREPALRDHGPVLLRELVAALHGHEGTSAAAREHGRLRQRAGLPLEQLVREYGLLHTLILDLAVEAACPLDPDGARVLARFIANATASSVAEHARQVEEQREALFQDARTARTTAEAAQAKLDSLFMQAPVGIAIHEGRDHVYTFANPSYRALLGNRDVVGKPLLEAVPELAGQGFDVLFDRVAATGEPYVDHEVAARVDRTGQGVFEDGFYKVVFTAKRNARGEIDGVLQCATEVTEEVVARRKLEELTRQVRVSEAELRLVMDSIPVLVSFVGKDERYRTVNRAYEDWFGLAQTEIVGKTLLEVIGPSAYAALSPYVRRGLAGEHFSFEQNDVPYSRGGTRDVLVTFVPHRDESDAVDGYVALLVDVTQRRRLELEREALLSRETAARAQAEAERQRHVRLLSALADQPLLYMALLRGPELRFVMANERYRVVVGGRDVVGKTLHEALPELEGQGIDTLLRGVLETGQPFVGSELCVRLDRRGEGPSDAYYNLVFQAVDGPEGDTEYVLIIGHDVTDEVLARREAQRQEKERSDFEQQLIGIVSHDLRTPLQTILLGTHGLLEQHESFGSAEVKVLTRVRSSAERMGRMVRDLLDFTQARLGGGIRVSRKPLDVHTFARGVLEDVQSSIPGRDIRFEAEGDGRGAWDADRLAQVLTNLVSNALKYSPEGSVVGVRTRGEGNDVVLEVHNAGEPIPPEALAHLFQPMRRANDQVDERGRSVGLGLYIVKHLVDAHGGSVAVQSSVEGGTRFTVRLPRADLTVRMPAR